MNIEQALEKLFSLHQFGIKLGLENTINLLSEIGSPHQKLKCFHVAGSNGKGSTSSFIASILMEHGYKVGLYTSPHFVRFNERIKINGKEIADDVIVNFIVKLENYIDKNKPTFFELTTAMAFKYFEEQKVDYAVIETGLGGRLDATNVIDPVASIITSISLEHTDLLGDTIEQIAFEKAGIIKMGKPVFVGNVPFQALNVIKKTAAVKESLSFSLQGISKISGDSVIVQTREGEFTIYETPLKGYHQLNNAALAVKAVSETVLDAKPILISKGIYKVLDNTKIEGRYEIYRNKPRIIFDSAHNPEGIESFISEFKKEYHFYQRRVLIFGAMRDKNIKQMITTLIPYFDEIFITSILEERAAKFDEITQILEGSILKIERLENPEAYIRDFSYKEVNSCLVVLGSMYMLGEIKSKIFEKKLDI
ncbi:MAG: FolC bifunctional protein [Ignavibacteria bacterium]|nr:MAG: FolC bifunctional protein [Ignavibacteria bacterium]KAF0159720.1 MAG: FolC bifunctional protein [Ignavibacteria bacterium]